MDGHGLDGPARSVAGNSKEARRCYLWMDTDGTFPIYGFFRDYCGAFITSAGKSRGVLLKAFRRLMFLFYPARTIAGAKNLPDSDMRVHDAAGSRWDDGKCLAGTALNLGLSVLDW